jgi:hypothetical protein
MRDQPLGVKDASFLTSKLGSDTDPLQFLREFTQNSIEADADFVVWRPCELQAKHGLKKLCIIDNGVGMTGEDLVKWIGNISSSGRLQSLNANYGVGAKISAGHRNPMGLIYMTMTEPGRAVTLTLHVKPETQQLVVLSQGKRLWREIPDEAMPKEILESGHGTKVTFMGRSEGHDTTLFPEDAIMNNIAAGKRWILSFLNATYYTLPRRVSVRVVFDNKNKTRDQELSSMHANGMLNGELAGHSTASGSVELTESSIPCVVHWWIKEELKAKNADRGRRSYIDTRSHTSVLLRQANAPSGLAELYETRRGRSARSMIQNCGIPLGHHRMVLYFEPDPRFVTTTIQRTHVTSASGPLPWEEWQDEFRKKRPQEILDLITAESCNVSTGDHRKRLRKILSDLLCGFKIRPYVETAQGREGFSCGDGTVPGVNPRGGCGSGSGGGGGGSANVNPTSNDPPRPRPDSAIPTKNVEPGPESDTMPEWIWVSRDGARPNTARRVDGEMEDRAACYIEGGNTLKFNADWRLWDSMVDEFFRRYRKKHPFEGEVPQYAINLVRDDHLRYYAEYTVIQTVVGMLQMTQGSSAWTRAQLEQSLSEEALTSTIVSARQSILEALPRAVGNSLGALHSSLSA